MQDSESRFHTSLEHKRVSLSTRSRLYNLEPIGIGTPYTESLSSYFTRLAYAHCVHPKELAIKEVFPLIKHGNASMHHDLNQQAWLNNSFAMNGMNSTAVNWVLALEKLTSRQDLRFLTMLTWVDAISDKPRLIRKKRVWCPLCYDEYSSTKGTFYEPLLWYLEVVTECPLHHHKFCDRCLNQSCDYLPPFLGNRHQSYLCPMCECYLGSFSLCAVTISDEQKWQCRLGTTIGELIAASPKFSALPNLEGVALGIAYYRSKDIVNESLNSIAKRLGIDLYQLWTMQSKQFTSSIENLLRIYFLMDLSPLDFLTQTDKTFAVEHLMTDTVQNLTKQNQDITTESSNHELMLEAILLGDDGPPNMRTIAKILNCSTAFISLRFPELYRNISKRREENLDNTNMRRVLEAVLTTDHIKTQPRLTSIAKQLGCSVQTLKHRFPDLCKSIFDKYRKEVDVDRVKSELEKLLANQDIPPSSMKEAVKHIGWSNSSLKKYFPLLCRLVNKKYKEYIKNAQLKNKQETDVYRRREVLETILADDQNPTPSLMSISRKLNCSPITLRKHFPELCHAISVKRCKKPDLNRVQQILDAILSSNERPAALVVLARELNTFTYTLKSHFPRQCADLKKRRLLGTESQKEMLKKMVEENENISTNELAQLVGCSLAKVRTLFPELIQTIVERHQRSINTEELYQKLTAILMDDSTVIPPMKEIVESLGCPAPRLRHHFPELYQALIDKRKRKIQINKDVLRQSLEMVLLDKDVFISVMSVARRFGCSYTTVHNEYPELCDAISKRYQNYRKERKQIRIKCACEEVKQIMLNIHDQGQYPAIILLEPLMHNPNTLRIKEVYATYHAVLKELGY